MKDKFTKLKSKFLSLALAEVPFSGWNEELLQVIEQKMELESGYSMILFEGGIKDLVSFYEQTQDQTMLDELAKHTEELRVREKIALGVKTRLNAKNKTNKAILSKLMKFYSNPLNSGLGLKNMWNTVDKIWYYAGDQSTDYNYYTKRLLLSAVYSSTLIYYLSDESEQHQKSWEFLDKRISNVLKIGNFKNIPQALNKLKNKIPFIRLIKK
jgi:ubiquinone biosynthesis protein COQ9